MSELLARTKQVILTQTNCQTVLENVLFDAVEFPYMKNHEYLRNTHSNKTVFNLDYRLAPFKACILFESSTKSKQVDASPSQSSTHNLASNGVAKSLKPKDSLSSIASDLKKIFYVNQINVLVMDVHDEQELAAKYDTLDEMGVPYAVYLPTSITKDGFCFIRNRDTSLCEKTHINLVVKHFCSISNALHF